MNYGDLKVRNDDVDEDNAVIIVACLNHFISEWSGKHVPLAELGVIYIYDDRFLNKKNRSGSKLLWISEC